MALFVSLARQGAKKSSHLYTAVRLSTGEKSQTCRANTARDFEI